jgi:hypothetical protein
MSPKEATAKRLALKSIDDRLITSRARQRAYEAKGDARSAEIEQDVQDRLLRDRLTTAAS